MSDNISILVKLFETLKTSTDKNEEATQKLIVQQLELVSHIKHLPIQDLKDALATHAKDSKKEVDDCSENVDIKTSDLMVEVVKLNNKVSKMILVVVAAFTILMGSYVIIRTVANDNMNHTTQAQVQNTYEEIIKELQKRVEPKKYSGEIDNESIHE